MPPLTPSRVVPRVAMSRMRRVTGLPPTTASAVASSASAIATIDGTLCAATATTMRHSTTMAPAARSGTFAGRRTLIVTSTSAAHRARNRNTDRIATITASGSTTMRASLARPSDVRSPPRARAEASAPRLIA